ncbi:glycosyltransferase family 2 protein [Pedobacter sp. MR2016-19]|uniref:glycosyltransferase family 2 protein n=1 Tax=Pedobacter sp. MR2016-19 TaxID=2780089 RepID=UPI001873EB11|nr:glycosyltransferase family 2 protein [Pedobacter sp. MR2016-19]MBE5321993.1 glycosyltransferase family 2 protein [Pedobacter sp. MR2016-19]
MNLQTTAIVVTYNPDLSTLQRQFMSVHEQVDAIVYVDNGSKNIDLINELFLDFVQQKKIKLFIISNSSNLGLGYAQNQGIKKAIELDSNFVLILDHDSVLTPGFVNELVNSTIQLKNQGAKVGAVGPVYINEKTNEQYPITRYIGPFINRVNPTEGSNVEASFLIASGSLISIDVLHEVGLMNEDLFVDYIDVEWSFRCKSKGFKLFAIQKALMHHEIGDNRVSVFGRMISVHSPIRRYYLTRNSVYMLRSPHVSWGYKLREFTFNVFRIFIFSLISQERMKYLKFSFRGLKDGIKGKFGSI